MRATVRYWRRKSEYGHRWPSLVNGGCRHEISAGSRRVTEPWLERQARRAGSCRWWRTVVGLAGAGAAARCGAGGSMQDRACRARPATTSGLGEEADAEGDEHARSPRAMRAAERHAGTAGRGRRPRCRRGRPPVMYMATMTRR